MIDDVVADAQRRMDKTIESTRQEFDSVRTGRASAALLDRIQVVVLRHQDAAQPARADQRARAAAAHDQPYDRPRCKEIERAILSPTSA